MSLWGKSSNWIFSPRKLVKTKNFEKKAWTSFHFVAKWRIGLWCMAIGNSYQFFRKVLIYISTIVLPLYCSIYPVVLISKKFNQMVVNSASLNILKKKQLLNKLGYQEYPYNSLRLGKVLYLIVSFQKSTRSLSLRLDMTYCWLPIIQRLWSLTVLGPRMGSEFDEDHVYDSIKLFY